MNSKDQAGPKAEAAHERDAQRKMLRLERRYFRKKRSEKSRARAEQRRLRKEILRCEALTRKASKASYRAELLEHELEKQGPGSMAIKSKAAELKKRAQEQVTKEKVRLRALVADQRAKRIEARAQQQAEVQAQRKEAQRSKSERRARTIQEREERLKARTEEQLRLRELVKKQRLRGVSVTTEDDTVQVRPSRKVTEELRTASSDTQLLLSKKLTVFTEKESLMTLLEELNELHGAFAYEAEQWVRKQKRSRRGEARRDVRQALEILLLTERALSVLLHNRGLPRVARDGVLFEIQSYADILRAEIQGEVFSELSSRMSEVCSFLTAYERSIFAKEIEQLGAIRTPELSHKAILDPQIFFSVHSVLQSDTQEALYNLLTSPDHADGHLAQEIILDSVDYGRPILTRALEYCVLGGLNPVPAIYVLGEVCDTDPETITMLSKLEEFPYLRSSVRKIAVETLVSLDPNRTVTRYREYIENFRNLNPQQLQCALWGLRALGLRAKESSKALVRFLRGLDQKCRHQRKLCRDVIVSLCSVDDGRYLHVVRSHRSSVLEVVDPERLLFILEYLGRYGDSAALRLLEEINVNRSPRLEEAASLAKIAILRRKSTKGRRVRRNLSPGYGVNRFAPRLRDRAPQNPFYPLSYGSHTDKSSTYMSG